MGEYRTIGDICVENANLKEENTELKDCIAALRAELEIYAAEDNWRRDLDDDGEPEQDFTIWNGESDNGFESAREALSAKKGSE